METKDMGDIARNKKGMALLLCLAIIAVLTTAGLELGKRVRNSTDLAVVLQDGFKAEEKALSGIHLAMVILEQDANSNEIDSIQEPWADPEILQAALASLGYDTGNIMLTINDELGKIQVNALIAEFPGNQFNNDQKELWERFLDLLVSADKSEETRDPAEIINCIKDWLDSEDDNMETGLSGAESSYYQDLVPPYSCNNGPFDLLDELFLVKGVSKDLLAQPIIEGDIEGSEDLSPIFSETFTVLGMDETLTGEERYKFPGTININTANAMVLAALLPSGMEDQAQELMDYRIQKPEDQANFVNSLDMGWYKTVIDLSEEEQKRFDRLVRYSSTFFKAECSARVDNTNRTLTAFIKREKDKKTNQWICRIIRLSRNHPGN